MSYFWLMFLVRLACLLVSVLRHWRRQWWVHLALLCRRVMWGYHLWFILVRCLLAMRVASVTERSPIVKIRSRILVVLQNFDELIMFLARCRFFVFVRSIPCVKGQFIQHFLWRATWQDHHRFISLRRHLSVRVLSATERLPVVVRACSMKCCDGGAACSIVWEWACPLSGTVFHVMLGDIRKHVFLRQWGWCEGWIILQVLSECVAWSVWALCQEVFLVRRYESAIIA